MKINNVPAYVTEKPFIVARNIDGSLWFYGAYDTAGKANEVAVEVDGIVIDNP